MLIGLVGEKGVGKDAAAEILCLNRGFQRFAFADALKREVDWAIRYGADEKMSDAINWLLKACRGNRSWWDYIAGRPRVDQSPYVKPFSLQMRELLQEWGMYRRSQNPCYWINSVTGPVRESLVAGANIVFSDVRFENEIAVIQDFGGKIWRIKRPRAWHTANQDATSGHVSEHEWKGYDVDHRIQNYGDLAMLERRVLREHDRINPCWKEA